MLVPTVIWVIVIVTFIGGLVGAIIPGLPGGIGLIWFGIALYAFATGFEDITVSMLVILGVVAVLGALASYIGAVVGIRAARGRMHTVSGLIKAALLSVVGFVGGAVLQFILGIFMILAFFYAITIG